jgi:hypothetical protein
MARKFPKEKRRALTEAYYEALNADLDFSSDLGNLFQTLGTLVDPKSPPYRIVLGLSTTGPTWTEVERLPAADSEAGVAAWAAVERFLRRWPLPPEAPVHVWSLWEAHWRSAQGPRATPRLLPVPHIDGVPVVWHVLREDKPARWPNLGPWIWPKAPEPFQYWDDHKPPDRAWLNKRIERICRDIRDSILAQAMAYEQRYREAGCTRQPANWDPNVNARCLYLRRVKNLSWGRIALSMEARSRSLVERQAKEAAAILGIDLP